MVEESPEIRAVLRRWIGAVERRDPATAVNLLYRGPEIRYVGTDPHEWWGGTGFVAAYPRHIASFPDLSFDIAEIEAFESGTTGWGAVRQVTRFPDGTSTEVRLTFVLVLDDGTWRIVQAHLSFGVPNLEVIGVELTGGLQDLLASMDDPAADLQAGMRDGTVTLVFTDIEDSTALNAAMGDAAWTAVLAEHQRRVEQIVEARGGTVVKTLGDGAMIAFTSTREAVRAAIDLQRRCADDPRVRVRIGVHVGDVVLSDEDYLGGTVNKAARIASAAAGGEIMVSDAVRVLVGSPAEFGFGDPATVELKGLDGVHEVTPVLWRPDGG